MIAKDILVIRELTKQYMEVAMSDRHVRMRKRFRDTNDLKIVRPPVLMDEIPWTGGSEDTGWAVRPPGGRIPP